MKLNKKELENILKLLEKEDETVVEIKTSGASGIGQTVSVQFGKSDIIYDVTDYECW
ncbi:hypothetical protein GW796_06520 [archaeon]|nr:hypothetical protein [archaeon]